MERRRQEEEDLRAAVALQVCTNSKFVAFDSPLENNIFFNSKSGAIAKRNRRG